MVEGKRQLVAIMFTDIVGYSALSHRNEEQALQLLEEHRKIARPFFARFSGTEVKTIGDAFLVTFGSAIEAVRCAIELQGAFQERNFDHPQDKIEIRIGIHLGDIISTGTDVYGDGVNIAARLQSLAKAGGIAISGSVFEQVHNQIDRKMTFLKRKRLKNIEKPVAIFSVSVDLPHSLSRTRDGWLRRAYLRVTRLRKSFYVGAGLAATLTVTSGWIAARQGYLHFLLHPDSGSTLERRRVAVLPFANLTQNSGDDYLSEGVTEELITNLSRLSGLRVMAKGSVTRYKSAQKSLAQIGQELQVGTVVEGSIRRMGGQLRISVQVIDVATQENTFTRDFDGQVEDALDLQRNLSKFVSNQLRGRSLARLEETPPSRSPREREAYLTYLRGRYFLNRRTEGALTKGVAQLEESARLNPSHAPTYAALANAVGLQSYYGMVHPRDAAKQVLSLTEKALALDPQLTEALMSLAETKAFYQYDWSGAEKTFQEAIRSNPNQPTAHQWFAEYLAFRNRLPEARTRIKAALELDPLSLVVNTAAGYIEYLGRNYDESIRRHKAVLEMEPGYMLPHLYIGLALIRQGKTPEAIDWLQKAVQLSGGTSATKAALASAYATSGNTEIARKILEELQETAKDRYVSPYDLATIHAGLGDKPQALKELERALTERASRVLLLPVDPAFDPLRGEKAFATLTGHLGR